MKLSSALSAAIAAAVMLLPSFTAKAETALSVTVPGDINLSNSFTLSDLVTMQNYLHGKTTLSEQAFINADLNSDGTVDIFDMCLFRKKLISESGGFTKTVSDLQYSDKIHSDPHEDYILSIYDLYRYFSPLNVITVDGDCFDVPTYTDEDIEKFTEIYNEEFFKDNILLLKTELKPDGGENNIGDVYYSGDHIEAEFFQTYSGERTNSYEEHLQLLQVVIPRTLNNAKGFDWVYRYPDAEAKVESEFTSELTGSGWKAAVYGQSPQIFTSKALFDKWTEGKFHSAVERSLKNKYNEEFFAQNALVLNLTAQSNGSCPITADAQVTANKVTLTYDRDLTGAKTSKGVYITQAVIPKGACHNYKAEVIRSWEKPVVLDHKEYDLGMLCETHNKDMTKTSGMKPRWVNSQEELDEYLGEYLTDEAIELINAKLYVHSAYVWVDYDVIGATHKLSSSYVSQDEKILELNTVSSTPFGDIGGAFLHILTTSNDISGYEVKIHDFYVNDNYPILDKEPIEIDFMDGSLYDSRTLFVNQYGFGGEYSADLYLTHSGGGPIRYSSYEYIGTIELSPDYEPFTGEYTYTENDDGSHTVTGSDFSLKYTDGILKVSCKTSPDSAYTDYEFEIGK